MTELVVVTAGLGQPSSSRLLADRLAGATRSQGRSPAGITVIELRDLARDIADNLVTGFPSPALAEAVRAVGDADGLIAVTPIFSASYSGLFKSFFDVLDPRALAGTPVLIGATGGSERHSLALDHAVRPLFAYLRAIVVPTAVYAASPDWGSSAQGAALSERITRAGGELAELMARTPKAGTPDPFADATPFEQLLGP